MSLVSKRVAFLLNGDGVTGNMIDIKTLSCYVLIVQHASCCQSTLGRDIGMTRERLMGRYAKVTE